MSESKLVYSRYSWLSQAEITTEQFKFIFKIKRKIKEKELHYKYEISFNKREVCVIAKTLEVADTLNLNKLQGVARCEEIDDSNST